MIIQACVNVKTMKLQKLKNIIKETIDKLNEQQDFSCPQGTVNNMGSQFISPGLTINCDPAIDNITAGGGIGVAYSIWNQICCDRPEEPVDPCANFENEMQAATNTNISIDAFCTKCATNSWDPWGQEVTQYCGCCQSDAEGLPTVPGKYQQKNRMQKLAGIPTNRRPKK